MNTARFLSTYFRKYWPQALAVLAATIGYAAASVLLIVLFQVVLSDVLRTDAAVEGVPGADVLAEGEGASGVVDLSGNLMESVLAIYEASKIRFGVTDETVVYFVPLLLVLVILLRSLCQFLNGYFFQVIGLGATNDLRNDLYQHILAQSSRFYSRHPSGELVSRVGNDISVIQTAISTRFVDLFQQVPTLIGLLWLLFSIDAQLAVFCLLVVPAIAYPIIRFGRSMRHTSHKSQERLADLSNLVAEAVRGHRVVQAFGMEEFELRRFRHATKRHLATRLRAQFLSYASSPVIEALAAIGAGAFLVYAGKAVRTAELAPSMLVTFLFAVLSLYDPVRKLNKVNLVLQEALAAGQRVQSIIEVHNEIIDAPDAVELQPLAESIHFRDLRFAYEDDVVIDGVDITIERGQTVAVVGPSGAGKSTLINLLPRFFDPDEGAVEIDGVDVRQATLESLRGQIGIVTQDTYLFNDTVRDNIAYGQEDLPLEAVQAAAEMAYAHEFIEQLPDGYDTVIGEDGSRLSGGQRQRLAIARALLKNPPILVLDEATSHLDSSAEALVQKALANLMRGRTALVIAHRLSTIHQADRILVMRAGKVVEEGNHAELLERDGLYRHLYDLQFRTD